MINIYNYIIGNEKHKAYSEDLINRSRIRAMLLFKSGFPDKARLDYLTGKSYDGHQFEDTVAEALTLVTNIIINRSLEVAYKREAGDLLAYLCSHKVRKVGRTYLSIPLLVNVLRMMVEGQMTNTKPRPSDLPPLPGSHLTEDGHGWDENGNQI